MFSRLCRAVQVRKTSTSALIATPVWVKPLSEANNFHDTFVVFLRFIAAQTAASPPEEIGRAENRKLSLLNFAISNSLNFAGARSASVLDVNNFYQR